MLARDGGTGRKFDLLITLGAKVPREIPLRHTIDEDRKLFTGGYRIVVWCTWRLDCEERPLASSDLDPVIIERELSVLVGQHIVAATCTAPAWDLCLEFSGGVKLKVFCDYIPGRP